ncbi:hypothetical protein EON65_10625 [archaeon]|nr:MAG: hypothetical protein EON65_10625 [archaeon]
MLQAVFNMLDRENRGYITAESLQRISHDSYLHELLQYTVLWAVIKKREWTYFFKLMESYEDVSTAAPFPAPPLSRNPSKLRDKHSDTSNRHLVPIGKSPSFRSSHSSQSNSGPPPKSVSYLKWMQSAEAMTRESRVAVRRIRTQEEHTFHCSLRSFRHDYWDNSHNGIIRNFRILRCLKVGDCVWGLHRNGVRWLPAVIEHVHTHPPPVLSADTLERSSWLFESTDQAALDAHVDGVQYTYDLWYPLSERDLVQSRLTSTSKQLLTLPSQAVAEGIQPKPFLDERAACSYAFDLADTTSAGVLELNNLIVCMQSQEMQLIIETSLVLAAIFTEKLVVPREPLLMVPKLKKKRMSKVRTTTRPMPMLLHVFIDTFSTQPESEDADEYTEKSEEHKAENQSEDAGKKKDAIDCVSKTDFLEFCDAVLTVIKYDVHVIRSK